MEIAGSGYPCGPCGLPVQCRCGTVVTEDNYINETCPGECELCDYCGNLKCPKCKEHTCCGGCV